VTSNPDAPADDSARWQVARAVTDAVRRRYAAQVMAVGVHGSLAHGDDTERSDVDLVVVTYQAHAGPQPGSRRIDGVIVDLGVIGAEEYLRHARTLSTSWPLTADRYLTTTPIYDTNGWHRELRDTHLARLAEATSREFATLAREAWCEAKARHDKAVRLAEWYDTDGAVLVLGEARTAVAVVEGLLHRTYFRGSADAVRRVGLGDADIKGVEERLRTQAEVLAERGRPVDGTVEELLG
jgi:Nucleotidyltransferase domain